MERRTLLGWLAAGVGGLAGCADAEISVVTTATSASPTTPTATTPTVSPTATVPPQPPSETPTASPTETASPTDAPSPTPVPAAISLLSVEAPVRAQLGESVLYRFTVENSGRDTEVFEPTVSVRSGAEDWTVRDRWEPVRLAPGARHTFESVPISRDYLETVEFRVDGLEEAFTIEFVDRQLPFDAVHRDPLDRQLSVVGINARRSYSYRTGGGETRTIEAGEGLQWVIVIVTVENRSTDPIVTPPRGSFSLLTDREAYQPVRIRDDNQYESVRLPRRETYRGWIGFKTPDGIPRTAFQVRWREAFDGGVIGVVWTP